MQRFNYYIDTLGGGWLEVRDNIVGQLGIAKAISGDSKHLGKRFFLDQRRDVHLFLDAYKVRFGEPDIVHHVESGESAIRMYPDYDLTRLGPRIKRELRLDQRLLNNREPTSHTLARHA